MKVLKINSVCGIYSTGRICTDIADELLTSGYECKVAYGRETVPEKYKNIAVRIGSDADVKWHGLSSIIFDKHGCGSKKATREFVEWAEKYDPDIIHLHNIHGYYLNIEILFDFLKKINKPVVWTLHDCWAFTGHCSYFDFCGCDKWRKEGCFSCPQKKAYPKSIFKDNSKANFLRKKELFTSVKNMTIVTPSKWLAGLVKESFLGNIPVEVIYNGIDLASFKADASGDALLKYRVNDKKIILGVAGAWEPRKGYFDFIKLASLIPEEYQIVMVGLSEKQLKKLPKNMIGLTHTDNVNELAQLYAAATVFFNPTYEDNFPTTNIESLACGTPVITYRTGGSPEAIKEGCGWVFEPGDVQSVVEAVTKLKDKDNYTSECVKRAEIFSKKRMCEEYLNLYTK